MANGSFFRMNSSHGLPLFSVVPAHICINVPAEMEANPSSSSQASLQNETQLF